MPTQKPRRPKRPKRGAGRNISRIGALTLLLLPGYELYIRLDDMRIWLTALEHYCQVKGESLYEMLSIMMEVSEFRRLFLVMLFLLCCVLFSIITYMARGRAGLVPVVLGADLFLVYSGWKLDMYGFDPTQIIQMIKLIPAGMIAVGSVMTLTQAMTRRIRHKGRPHEEEPKPVPHPVPRDRKKDVAEEDDDMLE